MADVEKNEQPQTNGLENGLEDEDERTKLRPADIDADVKEMERRKRVEMIMSSKLFREELERIIELQMKDGNGPAGLLQQISDMMGIQSGKLHTTHMFRGSNCVTPINDIRGVESMGYEKGEKNLRCKLACVFRLMDLYGWSQGINNQITARLNQDEEHFLVNPHGMLYNEITASSLVKVDMQGNIVEPGTTNFSVNTQGFLLHSAIQASRPDVKCVIHIKTPSVLAVSSLKCGLLPICQEALVIGEVSQHPFVGGIFEPEEREKIIRNLGPSNKVLLLNNHGAVCCGATVEEAFYNVYNTVLACETQIKVMPLGVDNLVLVSDETRKQVYDAAHRAPDTGAPGDKKPKQFRVGELEFEALIRMLDNAGFRTGYIYRHPLVKGELPKPKNDVEVPPAVSSLGYLIEQEELYKQGNWKKYVDGRNRLDRTKWLNSPNVYQKVEILETGTSDPKKITKWVAESSPTHSSTPVKIDSALQFVPKGTNPKEFKKLQQQIKENRRADKITSGPQSHILEGVSWEEAKKLQDANITHTGDQVILVGAASKGIIQRNYQHNALVYKTPYAKNPFDSMSDKEIEDYKQLVERKQRGDTDYEESQSESEAISSSRQDALRHIKSPLTSPQSATSETEEESRDEPRVLRIETKTAPRPIQAEVVLSDAESDTTDARIERSHSARYPKAEKPESVTLMNSFRKSWSLKREKDKSKDIDNSDGGYDSRNLHPNLMLTECERNRMTSLHWCVARVKQLTHKPVIVDVRTKALRPLLKSASDPCNLSNFPEEDFLETDDDCPTGVSKDPNMSISCNNIVSVSDLQRRLNVRKKLIYSAKMKFLGFHNDTKTKEQEIKEKASTSPMCALISEIRETINEIMSPERSKNSEDVTDDYCSSMRWIERHRVVPREKLIDEDISRSSKFDREEMKKSMYNSNNVRSKLFQSLEKPFESLNDFSNYFHDDEKLEFDNPNSSNCTSTPHSKGIKSTKTFLNGDAKVDENQNEERIIENVLSEMVQTVNLSDEEATYIIKDDSLLQTYSFTETTETEWYYNKTIMKLDNSQTVLEIKDSNNKTVENKEIPVVKYIDTGIDTDFTSEKDNEVMSGQPGAVTQKGGDKLNSTEEVEVELEVPVCESSVLNKSSETDSSFLKSSSGRTSNDVDTSFAFRTETDNSEKTNDKPEKTLITNHVLEDKNKVNEEELFENVESKRLECHDYNKQKHIEYCASKLPGISESPEYINVDTEDAPVTSSSKDTSPEVVINAVPLIEDEPPEVDKDPEMDPDKDDKPQKSEKKRRRKKNKKSSTKITVKKELKEKNSTEPVVSEIKLTIKNTIQCQSEKYEVKIQDVINTSEELSSSLGENIESHDAFVVENGSCDCDAQQNLEELQEEVSSTIEKLQTIEDYFENEIKKCSDESVKEEIHLVNENPGEFTIEYNYGECEEVLNESQIQMPLLLEVDENILTDQQIDLNDLSGKEPTTNNYTEDDNVIYFVSSVFENIGKEVEVVSCEHDVINLSMGDFKTQDLNSYKYSDTSEEQLETKNFDYISMNQDLDKLSQPKIEYVKDFLNEYFSPESKVDVPLDLTRNTVTENTEVEKKLSFSDSENEKNVEVDYAVNDPLETEILSRSEKFEETEQIQAVENIIPKVEPCEAYCGDIINSPSSDDQILAGFQNAKESLNIPYELNEKGLKNITEEAPLTAGNAENEIFSEVVKELTSELVMKREKLSNDSESSENFCKDEKYIEEQVLPSLENGRTVSVVNANVIVGFGSLNEIYVETNKYEVLSQLSKIENSHYLDGDNELSEDVNLFVQSEERLEECKSSGNLCRVNDKLQAIEVNCSLLDSYEAEQSSRIKRLTKSATMMDISHINLSVPKNWFRPTTENLCGQFKIPLSMGSVNMDLILYLFRENKNNVISNSVIMKNFETNMCQSVKEILKSLMHTQVNCDFEKSLSRLKFDLHKDPSDCLSEVFQETESEKNIFKVGYTSQNVEIELMSHSKDESNLNSVSETDIGAEDLQRKDLDTLKQNLQQTTHSKSKSFEELVCIENQMPSQNFSLCEKEFSDFSTEISKDVNNLEENKSNCIDEEVLGGTVVDYISSGNYKNTAIYSESKKDELDDIKISQNININILCDGKTISNTGNEIDEGSHKNQSVTETNTIHNVEFLEQVNISCPEPEVKGDFNCSNYSEISKDILKDAVTVESPKEVNACLKVKERTEDYQTETNTPDTIFSEVIGGEDVSELKNQSMIETNIIQDAVEEKNVSCQEPVVKKEVTDYSEVKESNHSDRVSSEIIGDENVFELKNQSVMENNIIQTVEATDQESIACQEPLVKEDFSCSDCNETDKYILGSEITLESSQELKDCSEMKERSEEHQTDINITEKVSGDVIGDENVSHLKDQLVIENIDIQNALEEVAGEEIVTCREKVIEADSGNNYFNINENIKEEIAITKTSEEIEEYSEAIERSEKYQTVTEILLNILREVVEEKNVSSLEKDSENDYCVLHKGIPKEIMISETSQIVSENSQIDFNKINGDKNVSEKICTLKIPVADHFEINLDEKILRNPNNELSFNNLVVKQEGQKLSFNIDLNSDLWKSILSKISIFENSEDIFRGFCLSSNKVRGEMLPFYENKLGGNFTNIKFTQNEDNTHLGLCTVEKMFMNFIKLYVSIKEHNPTLSGDFCEISSNVERILCQTDENPTADDSIFVFLNYLNKKFSPPLQAITWPSVEVKKEEDKLKQSGQARKRLDFSNEASNEPVDYVLNVLINSVCKESTVNDVINFMLTNEESPTDSLAEFEDMETIFSTSNMIVTDIIDSIESQMEGDVDSLPEEEEVKDNKDDRLNKEGKKKKPESMFKVIIATPTKKEIFINYSPNSSSIFNVSDYDKPEFCNSYIKTDDINEDFENLSSDNLEFFSVGSPSKNSFNSSFDSICSDLDGNMANPVQCCCMNCDNFGQKSPRSLAIIEEVDEGDSSTSSDYVSSKLDKIQK